MNNNEHWDLVNCQTQVNNDRIQLAECHCDLPAWRKMGALDISITGSMMVICLIVGFLIPRK